tara:strand:+ start:1532 stop:2935 length:1404 start_codon:yes stop_codon:yes gene_type:complete
LRYIDLFSGAGGLSIGLKKAGAELVYANEMDKSAALTFQKNLEFFGEDPNKVVPGSIEQLHKLVIGKNVETQFQSELIHSHKSMIDSYKNINEINEDHLKIVKNAQEIDLLVGGPPCQGFSTAGRGKKKSVQDIQKDFVDDPRNQLFKYFIDFVEYHNPKIVFIENVKGIKSAKNYLELICSTLETTGKNYNVEYLILNSFYFGVPQNRERVFIVGIRQDLADGEKLKFYLRTILSGFDKNRFMLNQAIGDLPSIRANIKPNNAEVDKEIPIGKKDSWGEDVSSKSYKYLIKKQTKYTNIINSLNGKVIIPEKLYNHKCRYNNDLDLEIYKLMKPGKYLTDKENYNAVQIVPYGTKKVNGEMKFESSFSDKYFKLHPNKPSKTITAHLVRDNNGFIHFGKTPRGISVREAARIQSFPDWYKFYGPLTQQFKQIGNAIPPLVAEAFGKIFYSFLSNGFDAVMDLNKEK